MFIYLKAGSTHTQLHFVSVRVINNTECSNVYGSNLVCDTTMCSVGVAGRENAGACTGDMDGPLVFQDNSAWRQIWVISFHSARGCETTDPTGYVRVAYFLDWISNETGIVIEF